jgi:DNA-binding response OmpR family regulator
LTTQAEILIVEDDAATLDTYARSLRLYGYPVRATSSAETAWDEVESNCPDVMIVDLTLPGMDGLALVRRLRSSENTRQLPLAIVTGNYFVEETIADEAEQLDVMICFKPLWLDDLIALVERLLRPNDVA